MIVDLNNKLLAKSINEEEGFHWKIWTENEKTKEAGGIYVFEEKQDAEKYAEMHKNRLQASRVKDIRVRIFHINDKLTKLNHGYSK
ncbi:monooxygenase [Bacillus pacificus]|nr:monooxygenase [Bacillus cereus]OBZ55899.1 monooxygenase [Bacillus cereus]OJE25722.1 monooxygenase [Bacillus pacificus]